jgi:ferredoxin
MPTLAVDGTDVVVQTRAGEPILAALCRHGYAYRFGCRRGGCGVCKVVLVSGEIEYAVRVPAQVLSPAEADAGTCLSCRAVPRTDTVIRLSAGDKIRCVAPFLAAAVCPPSASKPASTKE